MARRRPRLERDVEVLEAAIEVVPASRRPPAIVMLSGLPASGKSHLATEICRRYPLTLLGSDALRKALFKRPVYSAQESSRLFVAVHAFLDRLLSQGSAVLLDATNLREMHRQPVYEIAERHGAKLIVVQTIAPDGVARRRLEARRGGANPGDRSDADLDVYERMRREAEPVRRKHLIVDTSGDEGPVIDEIVRELRESAN